MGNLPREAMPEKFTLLTISGRLQVGSRSC